MLKGFMIIRMHQNTHKNIAGKVIISFKSEQKKLP